VAKRVPLSELWQAVAGLPFILTAFASVAKVPVTEFTTTLSPGGVDEPLIYQL
jgi:hypothetical protein